MSRSIMVGRESGTGAWNEEEDMVEDTSEEREGYVWARSVNQAEETKLAKDTYRPQRIDLNCIDMYNKRDESHVTLGSSLI